MKTVFKILLMAVAYLVIFLLGSTSGLIHPACVAYAGAILPLLFAPVYLNTCSLMRCFGAAAVLNGFVLIVGLITGEADVPCIIGLCVLAALAEIIRYFLGYDTMKGVRWSFVPLAFSFFPYMAHWWTNTEGSLAEAVEVMRPGYDQMMIGVIENIPMLIVVLVLTVPVALLAIRLAERVLKKQAGSFK